MITPPMMMSMTDMKISNPNILKVTTTWMSENVSYIQTNTDPQFGIQKCAGVK